MVNMYSASVNSPEVHLSAAITIDQTTITLSDTSNLASAPNLLAIGIDTTEPETVLYTSINGNSVVVQRGFEGVAQEWSEDTKVARTFTAYDHNAFIANISAGLESNFSDVQSYYSSTYTYFVGDTSSGWKCNRWDTSTEKMVSIGTVNKPANLSECQALTYV